MVWYNNTTFIFYNMKKTNTIRFGAYLKELRVKNSFSLRDICKNVNYDPSNWSKIERGLIFPPKEEAVLESWANALGLEKGNKEYYSFIDHANISQGIIPVDVMQQKVNVEALPAVFSVLRQEKPSRSEISKLIKLLLKY